MATVAELQEIARELGVPFTSKTRKPDLEKSILDKRTELANQRDREFVEANSKPIPKHIAVRLGLERPKAPRNVPLTLEQRVRNFGGAIIDGKPKGLTPAQKRRMRKKVNQHGE